MSSKILMPNLMLLSKSAQNMDFAILILEVITYHIRTNIGEELNLANWQIEETVLRTASEMRKAIAEPISKNKLALFSNPSVKCHPTKQKIQLISLQNNYNLFSRLYISCQTRDGDLDILCT